MAIFRLRAIHLLWPLGAIAMPTAVWAQDAAADGERPIRQVPQGDPGAPEPGPVNLPPPPEADERTDYNAAEVERALQRYAEGVPVQSRSRGAGPPAPRGTPVRDREHPEFSAPGVRLGGFMLKAQGGVTAGYDSNVLRDITEDRGDAFARVAGTADLTSNWGRHRLRLEGDFDRRFYSRFTTEDGSQYRIAAQGRLDVAGRSYLALNAKHERVLVERSRSGEPDNLFEPVRYDEQEAELRGAYRGARLQIDGGATLGKRTYQDALTTDLLPFDQSYRDFDRRAFDVSLGYELSGANVAFVALSTERRRYPVVSEPIRLDTTTYQILGGIRGEITPLIQGQLAIGVLRTDFADAALPDANVLAIDTRLQWLPTELTTVTLSAKRDQEASARQSEGGFISTRFTLQADHELLRNLILMAQIGYETASYRTTERTDRFYESTLGADWLVNRNLRGILRLGALKRDSGNPDRRGFNEFVLSLGVRYAL
jgi:hypothetical protein